MPVDQQTPDTFRVRIDDLKPVDAPSATFRVKVGELQPDVPDERVDVSQVDVQRGFTDPASVRVTEPPAPVVAPPPATVAPVATVATPPVPVPPPTSRDEFGRPTLPVASRDPNEPLPQTIRGAVGVGKAIGETLAHPPVLPVEPHVATGTRMAPETVKAANELADGLMGLAVPLVAAGLVTAPGATALGLVKAWVLDHFGAKAAEMFGATPEEQKLVGSLAAMLSGTFSVTDTVTKIRADARAVAEQLRAFDAAHPPEEPVAPRQAGAGATPAAAPRQRRLPPEAGEAGVTPVPEPPPPPPPPPPIVPTPAPTPRAPEPPIAATAPAVPTEPETDKSRAERATAEAARIQALEQRITDARANGKEDTRAVTELQESRPDTAAAATTEESSTHKAWQGFYDRAYKMAAQTNPTWGVKQLQDYASNVAGQEPPFSGPAAKPAEAPVAQPEGEKPELRSSAPQLPRKPVTPQLPPAGGGPGYVLPSFLTPAQAKTAAGIPRTAPDVLEQAVAVVKAASSSQIGTTDAWGNLTDGQRRAIENNLRDQTDVPMVKPSAWHVESVSGPETFQGRRIVTIAVRLYDKKSGKPKEVGPTSYRFEVPQDFVLPAASARPTVQPDAAPAGETVPEQPGTPDQAPLGGVPAQDGRGTEGRGTPGAGGVRGATTDRGSGVGSGPERGTVPTGVGTAAGGVGVPASGGGSAEPLERPSTELESASGRPANYQITDADHLGEGTDTQKIDANLAAIDLLKRLQRAQRPATAEEQAILAKYVGWGAFAQRIFKRGYGVPVDKRAAELEDLLTPEEFAAARASTQNAHYTSPTVIRAMYAALERLGFKGGRVLEPATGTGNFFGLMPPALAKRSTLAGTELDPITAAIAQYLYPNARIQPTGLESATFPNGFFDLAVSNVPFGNYGVSDAAFRKRPPSLTKSIHNYFFAKALDLVRPGGVVAFITSRYTMDAKNPIVREYLAKEAELLGAIRLPRQAFVENAGTEVVTDIIFLKKRATPLTDVKGERWVDTQAIDIPNAPEHPLVNQYFVDHPEMVVGTASMGGKMQAGPQYTVDYEGDFPAALAERVARLPKDVITAGAAPAKASASAAATIPAPNDVKEGGFTEQGGVLYVREAGELVSIADYPKATQQRIRSMIGIRSALRGTMRAMLEDAPEADIKAAQRALTRLYDAHVKKFGYLSERGNVWAFDGDPDLPRLLALESYDTTTKTATKADIFTKRTLSPPTPITHVDEPDRALLVALNDSGGKVDFDRMASLTGLGETALQQSLRGLIYQTPGGTWETADEYLSGDVKAKLRQAEAAAALDHRFLENVDALKAVQPEDLPPSKISVRLGAGWVPASDVQEFVARHLLKINPRNVSITYIAPLGQWVVQGSSQAKSLVANTTTWGTDRASALDLVSDALNLRTPSVYDTYREDGKDKKVLNQDATTAAREKQQEIKDAWPTWLWSDPARQERLVRKYNDEMNTTRRREFNGAHLELPGMGVLDASRSRAEQLRPHQKDGIWRSLQTPNMLAAHVVGAGKTYLIVGSAMEKRRIGQAKKPAIVVPNHLVHQWGRAFADMYPTSNVLVSTKKDFEPANRKRFMARIATNDWDAVIIPHSQYTRIPLRDETYIKFYREQIDILETFIEELGETTGKKSPTVKQIEAQKKRLEKKLKDRAEAVKSRADDAMFWEELGVDALYVDEAHLFKNLWFPTKMTRIAGLPNSESERAFDMLLKVRHTQAINHGGGVFFATGTPISNTMAEMYTMQRYLQPEVLEARGLSHFDAWAQMFGDTVSAMEISPEGKGFRVRTRFAKFTNMGRLTEMFRTFADVKTNKDLNLPLPKLKGGKSQAVTADASPALVAYVQSLLERAELIRAGKVKDPRIDNMLKITSEGRKGALDMRLLSPQYGDNPDSKLNKAVDDIYKTWVASTPHKGTQLVFSDMGTPKGQKPERSADDPDAEARAQLDALNATNFDLYADVRAKLIAKGVPPSEIAFIHDANTDVRKDVLFANLNAGRVRILLGSTEKMGAGMNVQRLLVREHHLDAPWRPSDVEQRDGRILRQGNHLAKTVPGFEVEITRYITKGSFDAYIWQTLESKARMIEQGLAGLDDGEELDDIEGGALNPAEMKAAASGNPMVLEKVKADAELRKLESLRRAFEDKQYRLKRTIGANPGVIKGLTGDIAATEAFIAARHKPDPFTMQVGGRTYTERADAAEALDKLIRTSVFDTRLGTYAGATLTLRAAKASNGVQPIVEAAIGDATFSTHVQSETRNGAGWLASIEYAVTRAPEVRLTTDEAHKARREQELEESRKELETPFPHEARIAALKLETARLDKALDLDAKSQAHAAETLNAEDLPDEQATAEQTTATEETPATGETSPAVTRGPPDTTPKRGGADPTTAAGWAKKLEDTHDGSLWEKIEKTPGLADQVRAILRGTGGTTLQSTILPGAAEAGEAIEAAARKIVGDVRHDRALILQLFAPASASPDAQRAAGTIRAHTSARDQRMTRARRTLRKIEKMMDAWSHEESLEFWDVMEGVTPVDALPPDTRPIAEMYRDILDRKRDNELIPRGLINDYLEFYWGHEWVRGSTPMETILRRLFGRRPLAGPESYRKHRTIPTMRDGIEQFNLQPVSWNPTTQLLRKLAEMDKSIGAYDMAKDLKRAGLRTFVPAQTSHKAVVPEHWVPYPDYAQGTVYGPKTVTVRDAQTKEPAGTGELPFGRLIAGHYYGPPEVVRLIENHLSPGLMGKSAAFDLYRTAGNFLNQVQLGFSFFHMMLTGMESVVSKQALVFELLSRGELTEAMWKQLEVPIAPLLDIKRGHALLRTFYANDATAESIAGIANLVIQGGGGFGWNLFEHGGAPEQFMQRLRATTGAAERGEYGAAAGHLTRAALKALPALIELQAKPIMEGWVPRLKIAAFWDMAQMELRTLGQNPDLDEVRRVLGGVWNSIDNRFGQLRYDNLFWDNRLKHTLMGSVRAVGWNVGTIREMLGAPLAQASQIGLLSGAGAGGSGGGGKRPIRMKHVGEGPEGPRFEPTKEPPLHRSMAWLIAMLFVHATAAALYMYFMTGKGPESTKDLSFPRTGDVDPATGRERRVSFPDYFKDLVGWTTHPMTTAMSKIHPFVTLMYEWLANSDYFGTEVRDPDSGIGQQLVDFFTFLQKQYRPITVANVKDRRLSLPQTALGITPARAELERSALENYLHDVSPPVHRTQAQAARADANRDVRAGLREAMAAKQAGDADARTAAVEKVREAAKAGHATPQSLRANARIAVAGGLRTSFSHVSWEQALHGYTALATPEERGTLSTELIRKAQLAVRGRSVADQREIATQLKAALLLPRTKAQPVASPATTP